MIRYADHTLNKTKTIGKIQSGGIPMLKPTANQQENKLLLEVMAEMRIADRINQVRHG
jgi:hypothetical protein